MKKLLLLFSLFIASFSHSQNKQVLYNFAELPQTLLLNPGLENNYKYHLGIPALSGISADVGISGFAVSDLFATDGINFNDKVISVLEQLSYKDHLKINVQAELFNAGFRWKTNNYISFGFYQELDAIGYFPTDILTLANQGNTMFVNREFSVSQLRYKVDVLGVFHAGITRKVSKQLTIGARFKIYSSALNLESTNNNGAFSTRVGTNNIYTHALSDINLDFRTSGLIENNEYITDPRSYIKNSLLGGNLGVGLDVGFTYNVTPQLQVTGSILDVGFVNHTKNVKNSVINGSFVFEGVPLEFDAINNEYWQTISDNFDTELAVVDNFNPYISWRPMKLNSSLKYSFGRQRGKNCYDITYKDFFTNAFGVQLFSVFRPLTPQFAFTGFFEKSFSEKLHAKVTYTVDKFSGNNIGVGLSAQIWKINFYGMLDNLTELSDISSAKNLSLQFGFNLIFN